jgi:hypothetical protein
VCPYTDAVFVPARSGRLRPHGDAQTSPV